MRSKNFVRKPKETFSSEDNQKPIPKQTNWDRVVYLVFLIVLLIVLAFWGFNNYVVVEGHGYVAVPTLRLRAPDGMQITKLYVQPGMKIKKGDSLYNFIQVNDNDDEDTKISIRLRGDKADWSDDLGKVEDKIYLLRKKIENQQGALNYYRKERQKIKQKIKLDIATMDALETVRSALLNSRNKIKELKAELQTLYKERAKVKKNIYTVEQQLKDSVNAGNGDGGLFVPPYESPVEGTVSEVFVLPNEIVFGAEPIMNIRIKNKPPFIVAKFDRGDARYLMQGTQLKVKFSDGTKSKGQISGYYSGQFNPQWQNWIHLQKYDNFIVVKMVPPNKEETAIWENHSGIGVKVSRSIF